MSEVCVHYIAYTSLETLYIGMPGKCIENDLFAIETLPTIGEHPAIDTPTPSGQEAHRSHNLSLESHLANLLAIE